MSKLDKIYENMPEDFKDRRTKRKPVYSSTDYVPGLRGKLIKFLICFIFFFLTVSVTIVILSLEMNISHMVYIIGIAFTLMIGIWLISLTRSNNLIRLLMVLGILVPGFILSPYSLGINIVVFAVYFLISLSLLARIKKPEKIVLTPTVVIASDIIMASFQLPFAFDIFKNPNSLQVRNLLLIIGIVWIVLSFFIVNSININRITKDNIKTSKSIIIGNLSLTVIFSTVVILISSFGAYKDMIVNALRSVLLWVFSGSGKSGNMQFDNTPTDQQMDLSMLGEDTEPSLLWKIFEYIFIIFSIAIGLLIIYFAVKKLIVVIKKGIICVYQYFGEKDDVSDDVGRYDDEIESSFDRSEFSDNLKKRWHNFTKIFKKKPTIRDMKDNKSKVRFIYKKILQKSIDEDNKHINATAREFIKQEDDANDADTFVKGYERARYSSHDVDDDAVEAGMKMAGIKK